MDALVPDSEVLAPDELLRRRVFVVASFLVAGFGMLFACLSVVSGGDELSATVLGLASGATLGVLNVVIGQRLYGGYASHALAGLLIATVAYAMAVSDNGFYDSSLWWFVVAPLLATVLVSARFGALCALVAIVAIVALWGADETAPLGLDAAWFRMLSSSAVVATVSAISWVWELSQREARARVQATLEQLTSANAQLSQLADALAEARDQAEQDSEKKTAFLARMRDAARAQGRALDDASAAMTQITETFRTVAESAATLGVAATDSGGAIREINQQSEGAAEKLVEMVSAVEQAAAGLEEMSFSVREVAQNIEGLSAIADQTSAAMNEMQFTIAHVEQNARATEQLAEDVIVEAQRGAEAVGHTRDGVQDILAVSRLAGGTIRELSSRIQAIDRILEVIRDVADQTQLLSLNAAIIASQAGRHGRGFSVVAGEIKKLADRTSSSTTEIADVIQGVQEEARRAVGAIAEGEHAVVEGLERSKDAERTLGKIVSSAEETTQMVKAIAGATEQQAAAAREVAGAMERVAVTAAQVAAATSEQTRGADSLLQATSRLQALAAAVETAGREQREGGHRVEGAVEQVRRMVEQLRQAQEEQAHGSEQILDSVEEVRHAQAAQVDAMDGLDAE